MNRYVAKIYLRSEEEGGLTRKAFSGMQPSIEIAGELVACKVFFGSTGSEVKLGSEYTVQIELPYESEARNKLTKGFHFGLNIGGRVIGHGVIN